jgi:hypothetical protein
MSDESPSEVPEASSEIHEASSEAPEARSEESHHGHFVKPTGRYKIRFAVLYGALLVVGIGAIVGLVLLVAKPGSGSGVSAKGWSQWRPDHGTTSQMAAQIAEHVAREYKLNRAGAPLLGVVAGPPQVTSGTHNIAVSNIAVKQTPASAAGIDIIPSAGTWKEQLCGIGGAGCSIPTGKPTEVRGRLVRREALEIALYTFKFVPSIKSIVAFMPPPAGSPPSTVLYLQKQNLTKQLDQPLAKTLPLEKPPLPTVPDAKEAATIDKLTLPAIYSYNYQQLQDASALLVLNPFQT